MTLTGSLVFSAKNKANGSPGVARLAIYYGYPSLVNGANGDLQKAADVFSMYDMVILGDGLEFTNRQTDRYPAGDPQEHERVLKIIARVRDRRPATCFFGYVCLGEMPSSRGVKTSLTPMQLEERMALWRDMGVTGIFLDEAGYDFNVVTRERQNTAVSIVHQLGLSAFMNAYFPDHLFSSANDLPYSHGADKNPRHLRSLLDDRDFFLLESFQVKNGNYESASEWRARLQLALKYRETYGPRIFATTTTTEQEPFSAGKFGYAWWTAQLYGLDGFSWGEPNFSALSNALPDRRCSLETTIPLAFEGSLVRSDDTRFWRKAGKDVIVGDTSTHSIHRISVADSARANLDVLVASPEKGAPLSCKGGA